MPDALTAARLRLIFDLFTKTSLSVAGAARVTGIPEDLARGLLRGSSCGCERVIYGPRRLWEAADARGIPVNPTFGPPRYGPTRTGILPEEEFPEFRELVLTAPPKEHRKTIRMYSNA